MDEDQQNWKEIANIMMKINKKAEEMFNIVHVMDQDVPSTMYSFMKAARFTHLNMEGTTKCEIVYNYYTKTAKIGNEWRNFAQSRNFLTGTQIIPDATFYFHY